MARCPSCGTENPERAKFCLECGAARLQQAAEPGQVLVGNRTAAAVRGFGFAAAASLDLRGKTGGVAARLLLLGDWDAVVRSAGG
jgi:zinc-ribbon domain